MLLYLRIEAILRATPFQVGERNTQASLLRRALPSGAVVPDLVCGAAILALDQQGRNTHAILTDASVMAFNTLSAFGHRLPAALELANSASSRLSLMSMSMICWRTVSTRNSPFV